jgi:hypothetical protein
MNANEEYKPVPVQVARTIAEDFKKSQVVILCYDRVHELTHTTTYGVLPFDKENAAAAGAICAKAVGSDLAKKQVFEDFHDDMNPAIQKAALDLIEKLFLRRDGSNWALAQMEEIMKAVGKYPRHG